MPRFFAKRFLLFFFDQGEKVSLFCDLNVKYGNVEWM